MLPYPVLLALHRPGTARLAFTPALSGRRLPLPSPKWQPAIESALPRANPPWPTFSLAPKHNPPLATPSSFTRTALEPQPSLPSSTPNSILPHLASPLLATRHSSLATSSHLTLLESNCSTKIPGNPQRITLFHNHQGVPQRISIHSSPNSQNHSAPTTSTKGTTYAP